MGKYNEDEDEDGETSRVAQVGNMQKAGVAENEKGV